MIVRDFLICLLQMYLLEDLEKNMLPYRRENFWGKFLVYFVVALIMLGINHLESSIFNMVMIPVTYMIVFHNGSNASEADILIYLKMHLPQYMIPKKIVVWDSFPLTFNGKIDRKRIDENYSIEEMQKHMEGMSVDNNSANELLLMWREALHNSEIQLQDNLYDYGVDSLIMAQMASKILTIRYH